MAHGRFDKMTPTLNTNGPKIQRNDSEEQARLVSSNIVLQARLKSRESVLSGCGDEGDKALEDGLQALQNHNDGESDYWQLGQAEIKLDQGKRMEARELLTHFHTELRTKDPNPLKRKKTDSPVDTDAQYEEMERMSNSNSKFAKDCLDTLLRADDWDRARTVAHKIYKIEPSYFNIKTPMDRFAKCRQILNLGLLCEHNQSRSATLFEQQEYMAKALRIYNHG